LAEYGYIDSHCHLERYPHPLEVLAGAIDAGVLVLAVTELPSRYQRTALRLGERAGVLLALGMHPLQAPLVSALELTLFTRLLDRTNYVGEVGLDGSREGRSTLREQRKVFEHLLEQPRIRSKVLTVHSRGAEKETIERLAAAQVTAILHWYTGALGHIDVALDAGLYFSVNAAMLRSRSGLRVLAAVPPDRIVTETDRPYTKIAGHLSQPRDIPQTVLALARTWNEEPDQARARIFATMAAIVQRAHQGTDAAPSP
jgi:TatD DNase family protein